MPVISANDMIWPLTLEKSELSQMNGNYVYLFSFPTSNVLDDSSVRNLKETLLYSYVPWREESLDLGHVVVAWQCEVNDETIRGATSLTGERSGQGSDLMSDGWGLSTLFVNYTDGILTNSEETEEYFHKKPRFAWQGFQVKKENCLKAIKFVKDFYSKRAHWNFSFMKDPSKLEGGGCSSFALEFLSLAKPKWFQKKELWLREVQVPISLMGFNSSSSLEHVDYSTIPISEEKLSFVRKNKLLLTNWSRELDKGHINFSYFDTDYIFYSVSVLEELIHTRYGSFFPGDHKFEKLKSSRVNFLGRDITRNVDELFSPQFLKINKNREMMINDTAKKSFILKKVGKSYGITFLN